MSNSEKPINTPILKDAAFKVENALSLYADSFAAIPMEAIYEENQLTQFENVIKDCHIYLIGYTPIVEIIAIEQKDRILLLSITVASEKHLIEYTLPEDFHLINDEDNYYLIDSEGNKFTLNENEIFRKLTEIPGTFKFEVKYIGQAYGKGGSRNAIDRLLKHETLQKIAIKGAPIGYRIDLLLLSIKSGNQLITSINPFAKKQDNDENRIQAGLDKLYNTSEAERISIYEAALIRYFYPEFNKEFKDSFPSTNLNILRDCYDKDFSAVVAEIGFDELPYQIWSNTVTPKWHHIAKHHLHKSDDRRMFFGM